MAETQLAAAQIPEQWDDEYFEEFVRDSQFSSAMGDSVNDIIQLKEELRDKKGDTIHMELVRKLNNDGVTGDSTLEGNEENLDTYDDAITIDWLRNAVKFTKRTEKFSPIDLRNASKPMLKTWSMEKLRDLVINRLMSPHVDGVTKYSDASEAQKDTFLSANSDRVLVGSAWSNTSSLDHSTSLANIDNTNDKFTPTVLGLLKRRAKQLTNGAVRPVMVNKKGEIYVVYAHSLAYRDFRASTAYQNAALYAENRGRDNPLFEDGDLYYEGCIIKEVPEIPVVGNVGAASIQVVPVFFCGAQAIGIAWGQRPKTVTDDTQDYKFKWGCAIEELRGGKKLMFNNVQHGMLTAYVAGVADA